MEVLERFFHWVKNSLSWLNASIFTLTNLSFNVCIWGAKVCVFIALILFLINNYYFNEC